MISKNCRDPAWIIKGKDQWDLKAIPLVHYLIADHIQYLIVPGLYGYRSALGAGARIPRIKLGFIAQTG